jgi:glutathione S-transferase
MLRFIAIVKQSDPEYLKLNPLGKVPAMIDGASGVMNQGNAILKYLARKYPEAKLGDDGLQDGYDLDRWIASHWLSNFHD